jgi:hypothetical protein
LLKEYGLDVQRLFLEMMLEDAQSYVRVQNIYNPQNFDKSLRPAAEFIKEHSDKHKTLPERTQIAATTGIRLQAVPDLNEGHFDWFMGEFEQFTKRQELERAILKAADMLEKGDFEPVEKLIKDAVQISLTRDMGTDYFHRSSGSYQQVFQLRWASQHRLAATGQIVVWWIQSWRTQHLCWWIRVWQESCDDEHCLELVATRTQWRVHHTGTFRRTHKFANRCYVDQHEHQRHSPGH